MIAPTLLAPELAPLPKPLRSRGVLNQNAPHRLGVLNQNASGLRTYQPDAPALATLSPTDRDGSASQWILRTASLVLGLRLHFWTASEWRQLAEKPTDATPAHDGSWVALRCA